MNHFLKTRISQSTFLTLSSGALVLFMLFSDAMSQELTQDDAQMQKKVPPKTEPQLYNQTIFYDGTSNPKRRILVSDFLEYLKKMTGKDFQQTDTIPAEGIFLIRSESKNLPAEFAKSLNGKGKEAFLIRSEGTNRLWIVGNSDDAIQHGIYYYLEQLGCRWFFPNDNWMIIPSLKSIVVQINRVEAPVFRSRRFFGTGGFGGKLPLDPEMKLQSRWEKWTVENRFGSDIQFGGHMGEAFNTKYKTELEAHPEWLAEVNGKRQPWSIGVKWCVSNIDFQKFFITDRVVSFKKAYDLNPDAPYTMTISVEPADGYEYCDCEQCRKLGSFADRMFTLANAAAKAVGEKYPGRYVNLYAYSQHAGAPSIPIEPNVYVLVIPYAFQRTGMSGDDLMKTWSEKKKSALGVYDYWAITDWANCLPNMNYLKDIPEKIRFWREQHVDAFLGESTYSAGVMGIGWYLASRLLWNPKADEKALLDDFYSKAFGPAAPPMKRMLERWADDFILSEHELGLSYHDITEARRLAEKDSFIKARVDDYAKYLHYIRLWYEYKKLAPGSEDRKQRARDVLTYIWRIHDSAMVQTFRMHQLITRANKGLNSEFPLKDFKAAIWTNLKSVTDKELDILISDGMKQYKPLQFERKKYSKDLIPLSNPMLFDGETVQSFAFVLVNNFNFWMPEDVKQVEISVSVAKVAHYKDQDGNRVTITGPNNEIVICQKIPNDGEWHVLTIPNSGKGRYLMNIFDQKISFKVKVPTNLPFVVLDGFTCPTLSTPVYFYVPKGLKKLALYCSTVALGYFKLYDSIGTVVSYQGDKIIVADVPTEQDGKVWSISGYKGWTALRPLNFPAAFSLLKDGLMIPSELKSETLNLKNSTKGNWKK